MSDYKAPDLPAPLAALLVGQLAPQETLLDAIELAETVPSDPNDPKADKIPLWLIATDRRAILAAGPHARFHALPIATTVVAHRKGVLRDQIVLGDETFDLPVGKGGAGREVVRRIQDAASSPPPPEPLPAELTPLPRLGTQWWTIPDRAVHAAISKALQDNERCVGLQKTSTDAPSPFDAPLWLLVTDRRAALLAAREDLPEPLWRPLEPSGLQIQRGLGRDTFLKVQETLFEGPLVAGGALRRLFELAAVTPTRALLDASADHIDAKDPESALALAETAVASAGHDTGLDLEATIARARALHALERRAETFDALTVVAALSPDADGLDAARAATLDEDKDFLLTLALVRQTAGHAAASAQLYAHLREIDKDQDFYVLQQARGLRDSGQPDDAIALFDAFIERRTDDAEFDLLSPVDTDGNGEEDDDTGSDLTAACLEVGALLEAEGRPEEAARRYLTLIRQTPYALPAYERLFALSDRVPDAAFTIGQAAVVLRLLKPKAAQDLSLPPAPEPIELPTDYSPLSAELHDSTIPHDAERDRTNAVQRWLGSMVSEATGTEDIERHCQRIDARSHPLLKDLIVRTAHMLAIPTPRCYLSHGNTGIQVLGEKSPLIMLGSAHLDPEDGRHLPTAQLAFAIGSQLEHIRAGHLMLTSSEFWKACGNRSLEGVVTVLSFLPTAAWLGKLTDGVALGWLTNLQKRVEGDTMGKALKLAETKVKDGALGSGAQSMLENALGKLGGENKAVDSESLVKEQLADFARGALYTADRVGLLACDDLEAAVDAIFRLSTSAFEEIPAVSSYGLTHVLSLRDAEGQPVYQEMAGRLGELFRFALSEDYRALRAHTIKEPPT